MSRRAAEPIARRVAGEVVVVPNGVDRDWWSATGHSAPGGSGDPIRLLSVGRLSARKEPLQLVRAFAEAAHGDADRRLALTMIGDGELAGPIGDLVRRTPLLDVRLLGACTPEQIRTQLARHDVFVAPARLESFGIAAAEARSAGLPIVAHRDSGAAELVTDGHDGVLFADGDLGATLARLAASPSPVFPLALNARTDPPDIGWDRTLAGYEDAYDRARRAHRGHAARTTWTR